MWMLSWRMVLGWIGAMATCLQIAGCGGLVGPEGPSVKSGRGEVPERSEVTDESRYGVANHRNSVLYSDVPVAQLEGKNLHRVCQKEVAQFGADWSRDTGCKLKAYSEIQPHYPKYRASRACKSKYFRCFRKKQIASSSRFPFGSPVCDGKHFDRRLKKLECGATVREVTTCLNDYSRHLAKQIALAPACPSATAGVKKLVESRIEIERVESCRQLLEDCPRLEERRNPESGESVRNNARMRHWKTRQKARILEEINRATGK